MKTFSATWIDVRELQRAAALPISGPLAVANGDALDAVVEGISTDVMLDKNVIKNLISNRAAKERRRRRLAAEVARVEWKPIMSAPDALDVARQVAFVKSAIGERDFQMLLALTEDSYEALAFSMGIPVGTLKARAARARARARTAWDQHHHAAA